MKLCYIYGPEFKGPNNIVNQIKKKKHDILHILSRPPPDKVRNEINYYVIDGTSSKLKILYRLYKAKSIVKNFDPDLIHLFNVGPKTCWVNYLKTKKSKLVGSTGGTDVREMKKLFFVYRMCQRKFLKNADLLTLNGTDLESKLLNKRVPKEKLRILYFGVPIETDKEMVPNIKGTTEFIGKKIVFSALSFQLTRGPDLLINSILDFNKRFQQLSRDVRFVIAGDGSMLENLRREFEERTSEKNCYFLGFIPHHEVENWMKNSDAFLLTSTNCSGVSIAILEAMSFSVPVICTDVGAYGDFVKSEQTGYLCKQNANEIASKINECLTEKEKSQKFAKIGRELVLQKADSKINANLLEKWYTELVTKID